MANLARAAAFVSLGSNLGDRAGNLLLGIRGMLEAGLEVTALSSIYESQPVETFAQPYFLNMIAGLGGDSLPAPDQLLARLLRLEYALGRRRDLDKGPRVLDLDLILYGDQVSTTDFLSLPHPRFHLRRFVLAPLAEVAPDLMHPTLGQTVAELLEKLDENSEVRRWKPGEEG